MDLGKIIKLGRAKKELTQEELANLVGVSKVAVWAWESNKSLPASDVLLKLAEVLDIVPDLFPGYTKPEATAHDLDIKAEVKKLGQELKAMQNKIATIESRLPV